MLELSRFFSTWLRTAVFHTGVWVAAWTMTLANVRQKLKIVRKKTPPICCNCNGQHSSSYKGCENYPVKSRFRKFYAESTKKIQQSKISQEKEIPPKTPQKARKSVPPAPQQLYEEKRNGDFSRFAEILSNIKHELKINYFLELATILKTVRGYHNLNRYC